MYLSLRFFITCIRASFPSGIISLLPEIFVLSCRSAENKLWRIWTFKKLFHFFGKAFSSGVDIYLFYLFCFTCSVSCVSVINISIDILEFYSGTQLRDLETVWSFQILLLRIFFPPGKIWDLLHAYSQYKRILGHVGSRRSVSIWDDT